MSWTATIVLVVVASRDGALSSANTTPLLVSSCARLGWLSVGPGFRMR